MKLRGDGGAPNYGFEVTELSSGARRPPVPPELPAGLITPAPGRVVISHVSSTMANWGLVQIGDMLVSVAGRAVSGAKEATALLVEHAVAPPPRHEVEREQGERDGLEGPAHEPT